MSDPVRAGLMFRYSPPGGEHYVSPQTDQTQRDIAAEMFGTARTWPETCFEEAHGFWAMLVEMLTGRDLLVVWDTRAQMERRFTDILRGKLRPPARGPR